jgi:uncharacterized repeat protein (TIGR02543 family)
MKIRQFVLASAALILSGLGIFAGVTSAQAWYHLSVSNDVSSVTRNTPTPAMVMTVSQFIPGPSGFTTISFDYRGAGGADYWAWKNTCTGSGLSLADCGISSLAINGVDQTPQAVALVNNNRQVEVTLSQLVTSPSTVVISFSPGAMTVPDVAAGAIGEIFFGPYVPPNLNASPPVGMDDSGATGIISINSVVTFYPNGGSGSSTTQSANYNQYLTANSFTRLGYTFSGWATSLGSTTVAFSDADPYNFSNNADLYAVWTVDPSYTPPSPTPTASPSPTPEPSQTPVPTVAAASNEPLAITGDRVTFAAGMGLMLLLYGVAVVLIQRRKRKL